jgi:hypothetical protein
MSVRRWLLRWVDRIAPPVNYVELEGWQIVKLMEALAERKRNGHMQGMRDGNQLRPEPQDGKEDPR